MSLDNRSHGLELQTMKRSPADRDQLRRPFLVGVTGGTGAGKTTFGRRLATILAARQAVTLLDLESYYRDFSFLSIPVRQQINFDDCESVDLARFREDLHQLKQGQAIVKPVYDLVTHTRHAGGPIVVPGDVVVAEGLMLLVDERVRSLFDLRIFIEAPAEVRLRRRLERDIRERGRALTGAIDHYMSSVLPIHDRFIEPTREFANYVIPGWEETEHYLNEVTSAIRRAIEEQDVGHTFLSLKVENAAEPLQAEESVRSESATADKVS